MRASSRAQSTRRTPRVSRAPSRAPSRARRSALSDAAVGWAPFDPPLGFIALVVTGVNGSQSISSTGAYIPHVRSPSHGYIATEITSAMHFVIAEDHRYIAKVLPYNPRFSVYRPYQISSQVSESIWLCQLVSGFDNNVLVPMAVAAVGFS